MRKLPHKYYGVAVSTAMALIMSLFMTAVLALLNGAAGADFPPVWLESWAKLFPIAWPTVLVVAPIARRAVGALVESPGL